MKTSIGKSIQATPDLAAIEQLLAARGVSGVTPQQAADRFVRYVANEESVDTMNDIILASAWDVDEWLANASMFADHRKLMEMKVGYGLNAGIQGKQLIVDGFFLPDSVAPSPLAGAIWKMVKSGVNPDCSVGFWPKVEGYHWASDADRQKYGKELTGCVYTSVWLKELSPCGVGAHPSAKVEAVAKALHAGTFNADEIKAFAASEDLAPLFEQAFWRLGGKTISAPAPVSASDPAMGKRLDELTSLVKGLSLAQATEKRIQQMQSKGYGIFMPLESLQTIASAIETIEDEIGKYIPQEPDEGIGGTPAPDPLNPDPLAGSTESKAWQGLAEIAEMLKH